MARLLEASHGDQLHEVAEGQAGGGRVEPAVEGQRVPGQGRGQRFAIRGVSDEPSPFEVVEDLDGQGGRE